MAPTPGTGKRSSLPLETKMLILKAVDKKTLSKSDIAKDFKIPKSTLFTILKNRETIIKTCTNGVAPNRMRARDAKFPQLEKALVEWLQHVRSKNIPVDGNVLKGKAETFALRMNIEDNFKASDGWLQNFKSRHGLSFKKLCGESAAVNPETVRDWKETRLKRLMADYSEEDIFNADETGLFFQLLPDRSLVFKGESCSSGKKAKQRITALLAANMAGTEKLPILIIGKAQKPRCFKGIRTLPVVYKANKKAWMVTEFFEEWVRSLDRKMAAKKRNILLVIDNCSSHPPEIPHLKSVMMEFLPPNVTSVLQPMDQGIIQAFKKHYRKMLIHRILACHDNGKEYNVTVLAAIHLADAAWKAVTQGTIRNCFRHAGFKATQDTLPLVETAQATPAGNMESEEDDSEALFEKLQDIVPFPAGTRFSDYVAIDSGLSCAEDLSEEDLIQRALQGASKNVEESSSEEDSDVEDLPGPTIRQTSEALQLARRFFERRPNSELFLSALMDMENSALESAQFKQTDITSFFKP